MSSVEPFDRSAWSALEVGLPVDDIQQMKRFYCEGLGFKPQWHVDLPTAHIEAFRFGNCLLKLTLFQNEMQRPKPREPDPLAMYITLRVSNLDRTVSHCLALGTILLVPVTSIQTKEGKTVRFAFASDPMGNRIELVECNAWSD
jgi:catechol 2,3-dioxygenase-like lactoylglutathione lyase family enzyme